MFLLYFLDLHRRALGLKTNQYDKFSKPRDFSKTA